MPPLRRSSTKARAAGLGERRDPLEDEARFLRSWFERPLVTGAVTPSGKMLARTMAAYVDPRRDGPVIELGPGTGPVTEALLRRGLAPSASSWSSSIRTSAACSRVASPASR